MITYYYRNPLDRYRTDQQITKQIPLSASLISKHVIHTHNLDKVTFNYDIYLTEKLTYYQEVVEKFSLEANILGITSDVSDNIWGFRELIESNIPMTPFFTTQAPIHYGVPCTYIGRG